MTLCGVSAAAGMLPASPIRSSANAPRAHRIITSANAARDHDKCRQHGFVAAARRIFNGASAPP